MPDVLLSDDVSFDPAVLAGPNSALPHGSPSRRKLASGDLLIIDIGAAVGGYHADITRTYVVDAEPDARQRELFELVHEAQLAAIPFCACTDGGSCTSRPRPWPVLCMKGMKRIADWCSVGPFVVAAFGRPAGGEARDASPTSAYVSK